ncbi:hypothetical protein F4803DRAFT_528679 [Xylaria telfairii]|nr:hypothetical protein F4803DRAFT_528679 [Xylaria telfairii]
MTSGYLAYSGGADKIPAVVDYFTAEQGVKPGDKVFMQLHKYSERRLRKQKTRVMKMRARLGTDAEDGPDNNDGNAIVPSGITPLRRGFGLILPGSSRPKKTKKKATEAVEAEAEAEKDGPLGTLNQDLRDIIHENVPYKPTDDELDVMDDA